MGDCMLIVPIPKVGVMQNSSRMIEQCSKLEAHSYYSLIAMHDQIKNLGGKMHKLCALFSTLLTSGMFMGRGGELT